MTERIVPQSYEDALSYYCALLSEAVERRREATPCWNRPPRADGEWQLVTAAIGDKPHYRWRAYRCTMIDTLPDGNSVANYNGYDCRGCRWKR